jgi:YugN-like family
MITIDSNMIEGFQTTYQKAKDMLDPEGFAIGGGWNYDHGYYAVKGDIGDHKTIVEFGKPFVIKHEFRTKNNPSGDVGVLSSLVNQFSEPIPTEGAEIDEQWVARARNLVEKIETKIQTQNLH